ncbi:MAG: hypothetical protein LQ346_000579 [Caloplaca aetnensis]|nr:MAG: hypothetical protein LQ346_000579 [Caloplaca aetnensis]
MPVLTRRHQMRTETPRSSTESSNQEQIWLVEEDFEKPQKEMDFPSASLTTKTSRQNLRLNTYSKGDLHDRYMSSEEEPSPSPDSSDAESTHSEELKHKSSSRVLGDETCLDLSALESDPQTAIAVAMPIVAYGRPKLIDITSLAPMQKRKRAIKQPVAPSSTLTKQQTLNRTKTAEENHKPFIANEAVQMAVPLEKVADIARKQLTMAASRRLKEEQQQQKKQQRAPVSSAPASWLPIEEDEQHHDHTTDDEQDSWFPSDRDPYGPYDLEPIQLRRTQHNPIFQRKRNNSNPFTIVNSATLGVGRGLTRTWSIAKKGVGQHASSSSASSFVRPSSSHSRGERSGFEQKTYQSMERQITKKPKMVARGANEREEGLVLPPCPFDVAA